MQIEGGEEAQPASREGLCGLAHVTRWESCDLYDLALVSWVGSVLLIY